ncbi:Secologanin synthase [Bertholletia excelsa]
MEMNKIVEKREWMILGIGVIGIGIVVIWRMLHWVWLRPKKLERLLRAQGFRGNSYGGRRLLFGDMRDNISLIRLAHSSPIPLSVSHNILPRVIPFLHHSIDLHGKKCFVWHGPIPRVNIMEPAVIKEVLTKQYDLPKLKSNPLVNLLTTGLAKYDGQKWTKHRRIVNPAFHLEKLKCMLSAFSLCCSEIVSKWEKEVSTHPEGSCELNLWPDIEAFSGDVISRTAFGSSYKEGRRIFQLQKEQADLTIRAINSVYIPGWRFLPTKRNRRMKRICKEVYALLGEMVSKRVKAMKAGEAVNNDLLDLLLESNFRENEEHGNNKRLGMSIKEVIEECRLFYLAGQETTSALIAWTLVLLGKHQNWQQQARQEVLKVFGHCEPTFDGLSQLKIVSMILNEVLRLYPPVVVLIRTIEEDLKVGGFELPAGVQISIPTVAIHHDEEIWGEDAKEFKPERFAKGFQMRQVQRTKCRICHSDGDPRSA